MKKAHRNKEENWRSSVLSAKKVLRVGDRIRVTRCPGNKRTVTFACWDGNWIVTASGISDIGAGTIDMLNGEAIKF